MITVTPIQEKDEQARLCALCGVPFEQELLAYRAEDNGVFAGLCQFKNDRDGGHLYHLAAPMGEDRTEALFVTGRATLNFMDLCGIKVAFFDGEGVSDALLRRIGFEPDTDGRYTIRLEGFFKHPCSHPPC